MKITAPKSSLIASLFAVLIVAFSATGCEKKTGDAATAKADRVLRLPMIADAKTFDPAMISDLYSAYVTSLVYEGLVEYAYLKRPHQLTPLLAEEMPTVSKDGLTYTFKIKKGVKFMDDPAFPNGKGRELKASDFVYSFLRVADPKLTSEAFWVFDGHIVGLNDWRTAQQKAEKTNYDAPPAGFKAVDDYTLEIKLVHKYPQLMFVLAMPAGFAVPREVVEKVGPDFVNHPVGTGPYKLEDWQRNSKLTFVKNPTFRGQPFPSEGEESDKAKGLLNAAGKMMPFVDRVEYHVFIEESTMWLSFKSYALEVSQIPKDNFADAVDPKTKELNTSYLSKGIRLYKFPEPDVTYTAFNMQDPVIKKGGVNLRRALSLAMDQMKSIELFRNGRAVPAQGPIPPSLAGYDPNFKNPYSGSNIAKAKEYLAKAGYPEGKGLPELVLETIQGTLSRQMAEKMQAEFALIGVKLRISANQFRELNEKINQNKAQMWNIAWIADYPDAENFLQLLYGRNRAPGPNGSNFDNPEYNKLYEAVRGMSDSPERRKDIARMQEIFTEELPWIVESHRIGYDLTMPWLKNYKEGFMGGSSYAKFLDIDDARKAQGIK